MNEINESVLRQISATLKTSSAVVPTLLLALIAMPIGAIGLGIQRGSEGVFALVLISPLVLGLLQISFFTIFDRDRLHNEEHIERRMQIQRNKPMIVDNDSDNTVLIEGKSVSSTEVSGG